MALDITPLQAALLGIVEGITEFLPVSSTGHLILAAEALKLNLESDAVKAFLVVIQGGALLAVIGLYRRNVALMLRGLMGRSPEGLHLFTLLMIAFVPAVAVAMLLGASIKQRLFYPIPVALALALGGVLMIWIDRRARRFPHRSIISDEESQPGHGPSFINVTWAMALTIGVAQCLALWPGTSRSMVTIVTAMLLGLSPRSSAEFSFLLALPTLGAATAHDTVDVGREMLNAAGSIGLIIGFAVSAIVAAVAIRAFVQYLNRHGLAVFGWYRILLAIVVIAVWKT